MKWNRYRNRHEHHHGHRRFGYEEARRERFFKHRRGGARGEFGELGEGKRLFRRGEFKFALLELLASAPMHGYQLIKAMEEKTGGMYTPSAGSVYPNLQLLEDLMFIVSSDEGGKKLYHITAEGSAHLAERASKDTEQTENRWERHGRHREVGDFGRIHLREFVKEYSDVIQLMARAAKQDPSSVQAAQFQDILSKFQESLKEILASSTPSSVNTEIAETPQAVSTDDE